MAVRFALVPIARLKPHERTDPAVVAELVREIRSKGVVSDPVWVARGSNVILNGHHRVAALEQLGVARVPALVVDYSTDEVELGRWSKGPPISKNQVLDRARKGELYPPKTTRHTLSVPPERHSTPLVDLLRTEGTRARSSSHHAASRLSAGSAGSAGGT